MFGECGVRFALEVHPTEIAFDIVTARRALDALGNREEFGFNFDPSHLLWQGVDPVEFIREFPDRIYHVHIKDAIVTLNGRSGILASHLNFGDPRRGWDFRSPGRGGVNFEEIIRALNQVELRRPALGRMGRHRHGPRARRPRGLRVRQEARLRAERRGLRRGVCGELSRTGHEVTSPYGRFDGLVTSVTSSALIHQSRGTLEIFSSRSSSGTFDFETSW